MPPDAALRVRFWGTRGSIPVSMTSVEVRRQLITPLGRAAGRAFDTPEKAAAFLEREVDFAESHTFGGNSSCVQLVTGSRAYVLCALGLGARRLQERRAPRARARQPPLSRVHAPRPLGPHQGLSILPADLHADEPHP